MTGIIDIDGNRCFVMPLNRKLVLPPRNMMDLVNKLWNGKNVLGQKMYFPKFQFSGYYEVDTRRIREKMHVKFPAVSDLTPLGNFIAKECNEKPTFMLAKDAGKICKICY